MPLKSIFKKSIIKSPPRIQRFLLRLQRYNFEMHYIQGSRLTVADTLSRAALKNCSPEIEDEEMRFYVHSVVSKYLISANRLSQFQKETEKDESLQILKAYIEKGWPLQPKDIPLIIRPYFNYRQEFSTLDGLILKENRIVIPISMRNEMKRLLHTGPLGMVKMKGRARETVFWPGITMEIEDIVHNCESCQRYQNKLQREKPISHDIPEIPWRKVGTDLFELDKKDYVIVVDYTSNFYDFSQIPDKRSSTVVLHT